MFLPLSYVCAEACVGRGFDFRDGKTTVERCGEDLKDHLRFQSLASKVSSGTTLLGKVGQWWTLPNDLSVTNACGLPSTLHGMYSFIPLSFHFHV